MAEIRVERQDQGRYRVEVIEDESRTSHDVTASDDTVRRYGGGAEAEHLIEQSFLFLLEREPKESILRSFDLPVIERYFPEYPRQIRERL